MEVHGGLGGSARRSMQRCAEVYMEVCRGLCGGLHAGFSILVI